MHEGNAEALWRVSLRRSQAEFAQARTIHRAVAGLVTESDLNDPRDDSPPIPLGGMNALSRQEMYFPSLVVSRNDDIGRLRSVSLGNRWPSSSEGRGEIGRAVEEFKTIAANAALALNGNEKSGDFWKTWPQMGKTWGLWTSAVFEIAWCPEDFPGTSLAAISYRWPAADDALFGQRTCSYLPDMFSASMAAIDVILADKTGRSKVNHIKGPKPSRVKAFHAYQMAENALLQAGAKSVTYKMAHDWLLEHGPDEYDVPKKLGTFETYVREGREGDSKNTPRAGRTGRSVVERGDI